MKGILGGKPPIFILSLLLCAGSVVAQECPQNLGFSVQSSLTPSSPSVRGRTVAAIRILGQRDGARQTPSHSKPTSNATRFKTHAPTPFSFNKSFTAIYKYDVIAFVLPLRNIVRPSNVTDFVMTIYINTIKRMAWRRFAPNAFQKFSKRGKAKFNTTTAVPIESGVIGIITSSLSSLKTSKFRGWRFISGLAVRNGLNASKFNVQTSARFSMSSSEVGATYLTESATRALALPIRFTCGRFMTPPYNSESCENLTSEVVEII